MVVVFAAFITIPFAFIQELGLGLAVAVLLDATVIRSVLLPASMTLLGDWNWWLPSFLRWLPNVTIEGEPEPELMPDGVPRRRASGADPPRKPGACSGSGAAGRRRCRARGAGTPRTR